MKVIIVGGVAGGASAAARLRRLDEQAEIVLLERGPYISFANCGLPYYISGTIRDRAQLSVQTPEGFAARFAVDVRVLSEAVDIDRNSKTVTIMDHATGRRYQERYDKLLLSPGAEPVRPPLPGVDHARIFTLRTIPDAAAIRTFLETQHPAQALIVGAGYIGMEMAEALHTAGLHVTVVEMLPHAIGPLDYDMACQVHQYAREKGVQLKLNCGVASFEEKGSALFAHLTDGSLLPCDLVLLSTGVRPDTALAKKAGLETNEKGAILVNDELRTSAEDIYAVGDAIAIRDAVTDLPGYVPLAGPANKQGRLAADNLCGAHKRYRGTQGSAVLKLFDLTIATTGLNERAAQAAGLPFDAVHLYTPSHASYYPGSTGLSLKVLFHTETGRILGAQLVGFEGVDKRCDVLAAAIRHGLTASDLAELELCYAPPYSSAKDPVNLKIFWTARSGRRTGRQPSPCRKTHCFWMCAPGRNMRKGISPVPCTFRWMRFAPAWMSWTAPVPSMCIAKVVFAAMWPAVSSASTALTASTFPAATACTPCSVANSRTTPPSMPAV